MGLNATAKGLDCKSGYSCGYLTFGVYRMKVAEAYGVIFGELYKKQYFGEPLSVEEIDLWNKICSDDLDIFLNHSDSGGKFTPSECRKVLHALKALNVDMQGHNYGVM